MNRFRNHILLATLPMIDLKIILLNFTTTFFCFFCRNRVRFASGSQFVFNLHNYASKLSYLISPVLSLSCSASIACSCCSGSPSQITAANVHCRSSLPLLAYQARSIASCMALSKIQIPLLSSAPVSNLLHAAPRATPRIPRAARHRERAFLRPPDSALARRRLSFRRRGAPPAPPLSASTPAATPTPSPPRRSESPRPRGPHCARAASIAPPAYVSRLQL
jgi:hypothetical protein